MNENRVLILYLKKYKLVSYINRINVTHDTDEQINSLLMPL